MSTVRKSADYKIQLLALKEGVDVESLLLSMGAEVFLSNSEQIRTNCIVHGGSNTTSLVYNRRKKSFHCWGECGFTGDVFALVQEVNKCDFKEALEVVKSYSVAVDVSDIHEPKKDSPWVSALSDAYSSEASNASINSTLVDRACKHADNPYVVSGKFKQSTIDYFGVGYCDFNEFFMGRAIIPIHSHDGVLVGYSGRDMSGGASGSTNKYRIKKGFKKAFCLYNLNRALEYLGPNKPLVIAEGFGQVWRLHEAGVKRGVALMGKEMTKEQYELVVTNATSVILALDFDTPGVEATMKLIELLEGKADIRVLVTELDPSIDLGDMTPEQALRCYSSSVPAYQWVQEYSEKTVMETIASSKGA